MFPPSIFDGLPDVPWNLFQNQDGSGVEANHQMFGQMPVIETVVPYNAMPPFLHLPPIQHDAGYHNSMLALATVVANTPSLQNVLTPSANNPHPTLRIHTWPNPRFYGNVTADNDDQQTDYDSDSQSGDDDANSQLTNDDNNDNLEDNEGDNHQDEEEANLPESVESKEPQTLTDILTLGQNLTEQIEEITKDLKRVREMSSLMTALHHTLGEKPTGHQSTVQPRTASNSQASNKALAHPYLTQAQQNAMSQHRAITSSASANTTASVAMPTSSTAETNEKINALIKMLRSPKHVDPQRD